MGKKKGHVRVTSEPFGNEDDPPEFTGDDTATDTTSVPNDSLARSTNTATSVDREESGSNSLASSVNRRSRRAHHQDPSASLERADSNAPFAVAGAADFVPSAAASREPSAHQQSVAFGATDGNVVHDFEADVEEEDSNDFGCCDLGGEASVDFSETFDVGVHVYDLSKGLATKHSHALVGHDNLPGVLHSGLVAYGFEYFFEGGVSRAPKGHTRFGDDFKYMFVGTTTVPQHKFEQWIRDQVPKRYSLCHYKTVEHNCHHFSDAACQYLCSTPAPQLLLKNTNEVANSPIGSVMIPILTRVQGGVQYELAKTMTAHKQQRQKAHKRRALAKKHAGAKASPPAFLFLFRTSPEMAEKAINWLVISHDDTEDDFRIPIKHAAAISRVATTCAANMGAPHGHSRHIDEYDLSIFIDTLSKVAEIKEDYCVDKLLFAWSCISLDTQFVGVVCYNKRLNTTLMRLTYFFHRLPVSAQVCLLRILCNYTGCPHGSAFLLDPRRVDHFLDVIGNALTSPHEPCRSHAASLLSNLAFACITLVKGTIDREIDRNSESATPVRLYLLAHYHIHAKNTDGVIHRLLLGMHRLLAQGGELVGVICDGIDLPFDLDGVMAQCKSKETRTLAVQVSFLLEIGDHVPSAKSDGDGSPHF